MNEHESNLIIGVRLLDSAVAVLQEVDFSKVRAAQPWRSACGFRLRLNHERSVHNLLTELNTLTEKYSNLVTGDPE